ncbi:hypothetical protein EB796_002717 [Bugula neritina]|uniref:Uncharacterized protein n=1 Tax=Bugula neritina TaxID=10212 RepID=A0A7J7KLH9_BUGNE|nr:hypothetical protein EB796_002717 [Bugula neritina]
MAIERRWINWASAITGAILLAFALAEAVVAFYLNLTTSVLLSQEKVAISGSLLVSLGVYIAYMVMICLSILDSIGMVVYQAYRFSVIGGYTDSESGVSITMTILQSIIMLILLFALAFAAAALCYRSPSKYGYERKPKPMEYGGYPTIAPPMYTRDFGTGYAMSLPRPSGYEYGPEPRVYYKGGRY